MKAAQHLMLAAGLFLAGLPAHAAGVQTFSPQGEARAPEQVRISFATPMIRLGDTAAPAPMQMSCALDGKGHWVDDKTWVFDIKEAPPADTSCRFTPRAGLKDLAGTSIAPTSYGFFTGAPAIVKSWPSAGARVTSTLDADLQRYATATLKRHLAALAERNVQDGAAVVLDNASGDILAWVGSSGSLSARPTSG
ncbi:hypothetical protein [Crenobacter cavernae]|uniref:hypothetical protein n=1 Tax=Crenobacter cavernae TaxID=2290923 RepID=UPI001C6A5AF5|nr:hypothetical protein [Crenobacter cavernae]